MLKFVAFSFVSFAFFVLLLDAQTSFLPRTGGGDCVAGKSYVINSIADLKQYSAELECIWSAGVAPDAIGLGFNYGTVLLGENSVAVQTFAAPFYQGDYVVRTTCAKQTVHFGILKVAGFSVGTAPWSLGPFAESLAPGEAPIDPKMNNIVMDFRQNVQDICPVEDAVAMLNSKGFLPFKNPLPPVDCFVDLARVVGRDIRDGGIILLAKGLNNDPNHGWQTSLIYALKNFDPAVKRDFAINTKLVVPLSFSYVHNGFVETFSRFGATGLLPWLMHASQNVHTALLSNPVTATLAMKAGEINGVESVGFPIPFTNEFALSDMVRNSLIEKMASMRMIESLIQPFTGSINRRVPIARETEWSGNVMDNRAAVSPASPSVMESDSETETAEEAMVRLLAKLALLKQLYDDPQISSAPHLRSHP